MLIDTDRLWYCAPSITEHIIEQYSVGPPVHTGPVRLAVNDLWSDEVWGPTECLGHGPITDILLAHPEIRNLYVTVLIQHYVVQLKVSVHHTQ